jgi:hypothetical protein
VEVARLQAAFEILDEASPTIEAIEQAFGGLEKAIGVTRAEAQRYRNDMADLTKSNQLAAEAVDALGISMKEYQTILANKKAMDDWHSEAIEMNKTIDKTTPNLNMLGVAFGNILATQVQSAASQFKNFVEQSADLAVRLEMLENVSRHLGEQQGMTAGEVDTLAHNIASLGITAIQSREAINKMAMANLDMSKAARLARVAQDAGTIGNINSSEAMGRLIQGITTMQTETLRGVGIVINMQDAQRKYAKEIGVTVGSLTAAQKQQATFNAVLEKGESIMGSYETRMGTAGGQMLSLVRIQENAQVAIGNTIKPIKELEVQMSTEFWKTVEKYPNIFVAIGSALTVAATGMTLAGFAATTFGISAVAAAKAGGAWLLSMGPWIIGLTVAAAAIYETVQAFNIWRDTVDHAEENAKAASDGNKNYIEGARKIAEEYGFQADKILTAADALKVYQASAQKATVEAERLSKLPPPKVAPVDKGKLMAELAAEAEKQKLDEKAGRLSKKLGRTITPEEIKMLEEIEKQEKKNEAAHKKAAAEAEKHVQKIQDLKDAYSGSGAKAQAEVDLIAEALQGMGTSIPDTALDELGAKLKKLAADGATLNPQLAEIVKNFRLMEAKKILALPENKVNLKTDLQMSKGTTPGGMVTDLSPKALGFKGQADFNKMAVEAAKMGTPLSDIKSRLQAIGAEFYQVDEAMKGATAEVVKLDKAQYDAARKTAMWGQAFQGLIGLASLFGDTMGQAAQIAGNTFDQFSAAGALSKEAAAMPTLLADGTKNLAKEQKTQEASQAKFNAGVNAGAAVAGMLGDKLMKSTNPSVQKLGGALSGAAAGAKMGAAFGPWGAAVGAAAGAIFGFINKAKQMKKEMAELNKKFQESHGGLDKLKEEAKQAGVSLDALSKAKTPEALKKAIEAADKSLAAFKELLDSTGGSMESLKQHAADAGISLQAIWDAKTPEEYLKAVEDVKKSLGDWDKANEKLNAAMDKYGISVDQLGPKFRQAGLDKVGLGLLESFSLLKAAGADVSLITEKMSADMSDYVNRAVAAGSTVPEAMRPMIEEMIKNGDLLDENGEAYDSLADSGITFAQTLEEGIASAVKAIEELVKVLAQGFSIPIDVHAGSGGGAGAGAGAGAGGSGGGRRGGDEDPGFEEGSGGFRNFGSGTRAILHGTEAVVTPGDLRGAIMGMFGNGGMIPLEKVGESGAVTTNIQLQISENPMQTAETVEQMRQFTLETVSTEVSRSLAEAIANGKA